ncbi:hypothetical protein WISP_46964 [Willisornis vidua]|uniref:Uncharacterized protein n=1 Tax=Willisornis vidua TaxID=1566151 RepID=A0ABQ9DLA1_9PASS|nr:hypothetical protein WISP_46964 [Willisornis vidua]
MKLKQKHRELENKNINIIDTESKDLGSAVYASDSQILFVCEQTTYIKSSGAPKKQQSKMKKFHLVL